MPALGSVRAYMWCVCMCVCVRARACVHIMQHFRDEIRYEIRSPPHERGTAFARLEGLITHLSRVRALDRINSLKLASSSCFFPRSSMPWRQKQKCKRRDRFSPTCRRRRDRAVGRGLVAMRVAASYCCGSVRPCRLEYGRAGLRPR